MKNVLSALLLCGLILIAGCVTSGTKEARNDLSKGRLIIQSAGKPSPAWPIFAYLLRSQYGIQLNAVAGCVIDENTQRKMDEYNQVMEAEINRRFGNGVLDRTLKEAEKKYEARIAQLKSPAECTLQIKFWIDGGFAGALQKAVQVVHHCPVDQGEYPFTSQEAIFINASDPATGKILQLLYTKGFWEVDSPSVPQAMDMMHEAIDVHAGEDAHVLNNENGSSQMENDPQKLIDQIMKIVKENPATQPLR